MTRFLVGATVGDKECVGEGDVLGSPDGKRVGLVDGERDVLGLIDGERLALVDGD